MPTSFTFFSSYAALWGLVLFQTLILFGLLRELAEIRRLAEDGRIPQRLPVGARAPRLRGTDLRSGAAVDTSLLAGRELVILFLSPGCRFCWRLADGLRKLPVGPSRARIAVCSGSAGECAGFVQALPDDVPVLLDDKGALADSYGVKSSPVAFVLDLRGRVLTSGAPRHSGELEELLARVQESPAMAEEERARA
ncbi:MAG TPA: redoxin domain-containing protein [Thermoanaerobaculia bacterium]|nr:redoxin domain-containing protein [Thermoanaerobaculia bacterium]